MTVYKTYNYTAVCTKRGFALSDNLENFILKKIVYI